MFMNGVLGGLVGITAGADQMGPTHAIIIGAVGGVIVVLGVALLDKCKLDDPVGAIPVPFICGYMGNFSSWYFWSFSIF
jgi:Amt family ammonium transporter